VRRRVQVAVVVLVGAVGVIGVGRVRQAASRMKCRNNLKQFTSALQNYHATMDHFPSGTVPGTTSPPERRLGWLVQIWPAFMEGHPRIQFDRAKAWDAEGNCPPYCFFSKEKLDRDLPKIKQVIGDVRGFHCPSNPARNGPLLPCPTHYVGVAGIGPDAAELPASDRRAGLFGYDRKVSLAAIKDGHSTTMALAEVTDGGPWSAGGRATIRGVEPDGAPYLGEGGQFTSFHWGGGFSCSQPIVTNVAFVDGSVRGLTAAIAPEVFEALATIAGGEAVEVILEG
jgi:prepilin-type processing-associated H-X9-DG protein